MHDTIDFDRVISPEDTSGVDEDVTTCLCCRDYQRAITNYDTALHTQALVWKSRLEDACNAAYWDGQADLWARLGNASEAAACRRVAAQWRGPEI